MNLQEKILERAASWRGRVHTFGISRLRTSLTVLSHAGHELTQVTRRHASRFVKQNAPLISAVREDVSQLARSTFVALTKVKTARPRKHAAARPVRKRTKAA